MWACSERSRRPQLRFTTSQTRGARFRHMKSHVFSGVEKRDLFVRLTVSRRGRWSKPRNAWKHEARPPTTFPNPRKPPPFSPWLSTTERAFFFVHPFNRTFEPYLLLQPTATDFLVQMQDSVEHETRCGTMIHKATTHATRVNVNV